MNLEQASLIAQIVSAVAVIGSLIFVGFQLKQATAAVRASTSQAHSALYTDLVHCIIDNADFAQIWSNGLSEPGSLSEEEWVRFVAYASGLFRLYESSWVQWQHGRIEAEHWHTIENQAVCFGHLPGLKAAWQIRGGWFSPGFRAWFEALEPLASPAA